MRIRLALVAAMLGAVASCSASSAGDDAATPADVFDDAGAVDAALAADVVDADGAADDTADPADAASADGAATPDDAADAGGAADVDGAAEDIDAAGVVDAADAPDTADPPDTADDSDVPDAADAADAADVADDVDAADAADAAEDVDAAEDAADTDVKDADVALAQADFAALPLAPFSDVTSAYPGVSGTTYSPCVLVGDLDGDLDDDVALLRHHANGKVDIHAWIVGAASGPTLVTSEVNVALLVPTQGCALADIDGDGLGDLFLGGPSGLAYYRNAGGGVFVDWSGVLPGFLPIEPWSVAPADYDGDGDLDLYVGAGYLPQVCGDQSCAYQAGDFACLVGKPPKLGDVSQDRLLIQGPDGTFTDETSAWKVPSKYPYVSSAADLDINNDGLPDVLVGNDFGKHNLLINGGAADPFTGQGGFVDAGAGAAFDVYGHAMGWGIGDFDLDGALDLLNTDLGPTHLYLRAPLPAGSPAGTWPAFEDVTVSWGLAALTWQTSSWNPLVHDFDRDGDEDVLLGLSLHTPSNDDFIATQTACSTFQPPATSTDLLLRNEAGAGFVAERLPPLGSPDILNIAQGLVDLDGDGDLDIVQVRPDSKPPLSRLRVLRNDVPKLGGEVRLVLVGKPGNRDAIGAVVTATIDGAPRQRRVFGNTGTGSTTSRHVRVGLGGAGTLDDVVVTWPEGAKQALGALAADTAWKVEQVGGAVTALP